MDVSAMWAVGAQGAHSVWLEVEAFVHAFTITLVIASFWWLVFCVVAWLAMATVTFTQDQRSRTAATAAGAAVPEATEQGRPALLIALGITGLLCLAPMVSVLARSGGVWVVFGGLLTLDVLAALLLRAFARANRDVRDAGRVASRSVTVAYVLVTAGLWSSFCIGWWIAMFVAVWTANPLA